MVLKTFISGFSPSPILPGGSSHSVEMDCHPEMGVWKFAFQLEGERARRGRVVTRLTPLSVVDGSSGVLKITSFLPPCLAPASAPVVLLFHPYHTLSSPTFTLPVLWVVPLASPLSNFSPSPPSSLAPNLKRAAFSRNFLPFHSTPLLFRFGKCVVPLCNAPPAPQFRPLSPSTCTDKS